MNDQREFISANIINKDELRDIRDYHHKKGAHKSMTQILEDLIHFEYEGLGVEAYLARRLEYDKKFE